MTRLNILPEHSVDCYPFSTMPSLSHSSVLNVALGETRNFAFPATLYTYSLALYTVLVQQGWKPRSNSH